MFTIRTFIVHPSGKTFSTSPMSELPFLNMRGDKSDAYYRAHRAAALEAAHTRRPTYVTRDDTGNRHYGFGPGAILRSTTALRQIIDSGVKAYFDFASEEWKPLPYVEEEVEKRGVVEA